MFAVWEEALSQIHRERSWYVVRTKPRRESFAQDELARRGVETFLPRLVETGLGISQPSASALFPGYLFVHVALELHHARIAWAPGVLGLVTFGDVAAPVDDDAVQFIRERCGSDGVLRLERTFHLGDLVRVKRGPLAGLTGVVEGRLNGAGRVQVLMELLRRKTCVHVPLELLEPVSAA